MKSVMAFIGMVMVLIACNKSGKSSPAGQEELATDYFKRAEEFFDQQDYKSAISLLDSALDIKGDHVSSITTRASALYNIEDYDGTLMDYDKAIELWPAGEESKVELIGIYLERGDTHYAMQNYELAIIDFSKAIEMDPTNVLAYIYRGDARDNSGFQKEAIEDYNKAIELVRTMAQPITTVP